MKTISNMSLVAALVLAIGGCTTEEAVNAPAPGENAKVAAKAPAKPAAAKPAKPKSFQQKLNDFNNDLNRRRVTATEATTQLVKFRDEVAGTNKGDRAAVELRIMDWCKMPGWTSLKRWDKTLQDKYYPEFAIPALKDKSLWIQTRMGYAGHYCRWLAGLKRYDEADKIVDDLIAEAKTIKKLNPSVLADLYNMKATCRNWRYDYAGAMAAAKEAMKYNVGAGRHKACQLAIEYDHPEEALALWKNENVYSRICYFTEVRSGSAHLVKDEALKYVMCPTNPPKNRSEIVNRLFLFTKSPEASKARAAVANVYIPHPGYWYLNNQMNDIYVKGDWAFFAEIYEFARMKSYDTPAGHRAYVFALAAAGRVADAKNQVAIYLKDEKLSDVERARLGALQAVINDRDALEPLAAIKDMAKEYATAVRNTATWCLNLEKNDACRRYSEAYQKLVRPQAKRFYGVKWFDKAVTSISDWRQIESGLEKSYVDIKMAGDLDNLVTDVATGRVAVEKTEKDSNDAMFEVTSLCDVNGLSIFLRVNDANARLVEKGLAGGLGTEMYFAPGDNQPYICFGSTPRAGVEFCFQTTYTWKDHQRLNVKGPRDRYSLVSEVGFTDSDYVLRLFFPWDAFYQKLPVKGSEWKFDCLAFGPKGGFSWGGSQGVHESSSWGRLVFDLTDAQLRAIKRRLIYASYKSWNVSANGELAPFDKWGDPVVGDPDFYKTALKPLEAELVGYQKRVTADMTDADVDEIYAKALPRWIGIRHVIDEIRRDYLLTH